MLKIQHLEAGLVIMKPFKAASNRKDEEFFVKTEAS
jgi:hypothetical protein